LLVLGISFLSKPGALSHRFVSYWECGRVTVKVTIDLVKFNPVALAI